MRRQFDMYLKEETKRNIERTVGLPFEKIQTLTTEEEIAYIENRTGKKLQFPNSIDWRFVTTGEPLITMGRCRTIEEIDRQIDELVKPKSFTERVKNWRSKQ